MKPALTPHQFVDTWANVHLKESAAYVTHFDDLCTLVGHPKPAHMDKTGETFETFPFPWPPGQEFNRGEAFAGDAEPIDNAAKSGTSIDGKVLPNASPLQREHAIAQAAKELAELRDNWLNPYKDQPAPIDVTLKKRTLTNLYNENPTWLQNAHRKLDEAVFAAYGWPADLSDDEILARLLALNLKRAGQS